MVAIAIVCDEAESSRWTKQMPLTKLLQFSGETTGTEIVLDRFPVTFSGKFFSSFFLETVLRKLNYFRLISCRSSFSAWVEICSCRTGICVTRYISRRACCLITFFANFNLTFEDHWLGRRSKSCSSESKLSFLFSKSLFF